MKAFFKRGKRSPAELVKTASQALAVLEDEKTDEKNVKKNAEKVSSALSSMKYMLYGDMGNDPRQDQIQKLTEALFESDLLLELLNNLRSLEFEARKDVVQIYNYVLHHLKAESVAYVQAHKEILERLADGYEDSELAQNCGPILREVIRHEELNDMLLNSPLFYKFFDFVQLSTFDVATDAFSSFKLMLTKHKASCAKYLDANYEPIFTKYNQLLREGNYVTRRQSLKLLSELLLNRANFSIMMKYINDPENLKVIMILLSRGNTKAIQFEAFHVFKIFVANPKKSRPVIEILVRNRDKLLQFLAKFQKDKDDDNFNKEKKYLLTTLKQLQMPTDEEEKASS